MIRPADQLQRWLPPRRGEVGADGEGDVVRLDLTGRELDLGEDQRARLRGYNLRRIDAASVSSTPGMVRISWMMTRLSASRSGARSSASASSADQGEAAEAPLLQVPELDGGVAVAGGQRAVVQRVEGQAEHRAGLMG